MSQSDIAATYGRDAEEAFAAIERDKETAAAYGLKMAYEPFGEKQPVPADIIVEDSQ